MKIIAWNDGHTLRGKGTGASSLIKETDRNRAIGTRARQILEADYEDIKIINCTIDESSDDMKEAVTIANNAKADIFISNHVNAGGGVGFEGFYSRLACQKTIDLGRVIYDELIVTNSCLRARRYCDDFGYKGFDLYVLKYTNMPSLLFEIGFVDNQECVRAINNEEVAQAYARGIAKALGLKKKEIQHKTRAIVSVDNLALRDKDSVEGNILAMASKDMLVEIKWTTLGWHYITLPNGKEGYVESKYVRKLSKSFNCHAKNAPIMAEANKFAVSTGLVGSGEVVSIKWTELGWYYIVRENGEEGYVDAGYLSLDM